MLDLISWKQATSGLVSLSQVRAPSSRALAPLMFQVAMRMPPLHTSACLGSSGMRRTAGRGRRAQPGPSKQVELFPLRLGNFALQDVAEVGCAHAIAGEDATIAELVPVSPIADCPAGAPRATLLSTVGCASASIRTRSTLATFLSLAKVSRPDRLHSWIIRVCGSSACIRLSSPVWRRRPACPEECQPRECQPSQPRRSVPHYATSFPLRSKAPCPAARSPAGKTLKMR